MNNKIKLKIFLALFLSFLASNILVKTVFIANSPIIDKDFVASLFIKRSNNNVILLSKELDFIPLAKGVYAKEDTSTNTVYIHVTKDVEFEERNVKIDGEALTVRFAKR